MKPGTLYKILSFITLFCFSAIMAFAETATKGQVTIQYETLEDGGIKVKNVWNNFDRQIELKIDGTPIYINAKSSAPLNQYARKHVRYSFKGDGGGDLLWSLSSKPSPKKEVTTVEEPVQSLRESREERINTESRKNTEIRTESRKEERISIEPSVDLKPSKPSAGALVGYFDRLNQDEFFGTDAVSAYIEEVETLCRSIDSAQDKQQFIIDNDIELFLENSKREINERKGNLASIAQEIMGFSKGDATNRASTLSLVVETLNNRLTARENAYNKLDAVVANVNDSNSNSSHSLGERIVNYGVLGAILAFLIVLGIVMARRRKEKQNTGSNGVSQSATPKDSTSSDNPAIVVRRKTTSILKKQCIDDVIDNPAYLEINSTDFTSDSAIRKMYVKNTCIKDIYNLYAEDLRNSDNPKEDGCMVLGRWVRDESTHTYDISLEEVVFPGDDAVFKEYELNFGGKIKLRIAERLRKLRRDTNLQYDLVCWIHSHPGLGVFFSNSDDNVQMQLKHPQHPNFLTAFVVDILTPDQEMGIFTFRKDGSMNSKRDIIKMQSLEEMYKWALQSEHSSFSHDNYYNIIENAKLKLPLCGGVELNNSSIIDLTRIVIEPATGIVGWAVGTTIDNKGSQEYVVSSIASNSAKPGAGVIGCLISMTHMSFPTIQRLISTDNTPLSFVMVYSSKQMSLTTIPVINGELLSDEQFYGDVNIEDLKIWTRRKR